LYGIGLLGLLALSLFGVPTVVRTVSFEYLAAITVAILLLIIFFFSSYYWKAVIRWKEVR